MIDPTQHPEEQPDTRTHPEKVKDAFEDTFHPTDFTVFVDPANISLSPTSKKYAVAVLKGLKKEEKKREFIALAQSLVPHLATSPVWMKIAGTRSAEHGHSTQEALGQCAFEMAFGFLCAKTQMGMDDAIEKAIQIYDPKLNSTLMQEAVQHALDNPEPRPSRMAQFHAPKNQPIVDPRGNPLT